MRKSQFDSSQREQDWLASPAEMRPLPEPEVIITHESDLDGFVSGLLLRKLARKAFGREVELKAFTYNYWSQYPLRERSGWIADIAFEPRMDRNHWLIVDHHHTAAEPKLAQLVHNPKRSSSRLCYELCCEHGISDPGLERLVELSDVADLFLEDAPEFCMAMDYAALVTTYSFWKLYALIEGRLEQLLDHPLLKVMETRRTIEDPLGFEISKSNLVEITPTLGYVEVFVGNSNLIVHRLLKDPEVQPSVLMTLHRKGNGPVSASFRSRNGRALEVAQSLQGGGHPNASGACLPRTIHHIPDALDYIRKTLNPQVPPGEPSKESTGVRSLFDAIEDKQD